MNIKNLQMFLSEIRDDISDLSREAMSQKGKDIKLQADKDLNDKITSYFMENSNYPVISEENETNLDYTKVDGKYWVVDPLDGSFNFNRNIPIFCVSIGLWENGEPLAGLIYDLMRGDMYLGVLDKSDIFDDTGAWCNGKPMQTSKIEEISKGVISTGFPSWRDYSDESLTGFVKKIQEWKKIRMIGSAAMSLAWVASGLVEAYCEEDIRIWDVAAGIAIVKAAGGNIHFKQGDRINFLTVAVTNGQINIDELI